MQVFNPYRIVFCEEAQRLLEEYGERVKELMNHHQRQFEAIMEGDSDSYRFDIVIHEALERKQNAKYAYLLHVDAHGCGLWHETD